jgi:F1F0 ATPase subunit 2
MMNEVWSLGTALLAGLLLGVFFFAGLWWTVRHGLASEHAARWFLGSMLLRTSVVLAGFYYIMGDSWQRLLTGLIGFSIARLIVMRCTRNLDQAAQEAGHAS